MNLRAFEIPACGALMFIEAENNRDPFRSYISLFVEKRPTMVKSVPAIFDKFALEELKLIAIVSGTATPLAMFRDPGGLGQVIRRPERQRQRVRACPLATSLPK